MITTPSVYAECETCHRLSSEIKLINEAGVWFDTEVEDSLEVSGWVVTAGGETYCIEHWPREN